MMKNGKQKGFTLVEMIVSLGLFTIVLFIATSAFLSIVSSDRKSRSVRIAADNLNIALEDMSRRVKTGTSYYCGPGGGNASSTQDCAVGSDQNTLFFTDQSGTRMSYKKSGDSIMRAVVPDAGIPVTSSEIKIDSLNFIVSGSASGPGNTEQPIVVIAIKGSLGQGSASSSFMMQTSVTQRSYDN